MLRQMKYLSILFLLEKVNLKYLIAKRPLFANLLVVVIMKIMRIENKFNRLESVQDKQKNYEIILEYKENLAVPNPKDFMGIYLKEVIGKDLNRLRLTEKRIAEDYSKLGVMEREILDENKKRGECLEIILADQIYDGDWFGPEAMTSITSEYDDIVNGIDMIVEFDKEKPQRMALAVDASTASDVGIIEEKRYL